MGNENGIALPEFFFQCFVPIAPVIDDKNLIRNPKTPIWTVTPLLANHQIAHSLITGSLQNLQCGMAPERCNDKIAWLLFRRRTHTVPHAGTLLGLITLRKHTIHRKLDDLRMTTIAI